jgi:hypothetical protein
MSSSHQYTHLPVSDTDEQSGKRYSEAPILSMQQKLQRLYPTIITAILVTSTISLFITHYFHLFTHAFLASSDLLNLNSSNAISSSIYKNCGNTPSTARTRDCSFDLLSFAWQTPECYDSALVSAFLDYPAEPWRYYTNSSAVEEVSPVVAARGEMDLHVTWEYHVVHCTFMWMQMHRAFAGRGYIDSHLDSWNHTKHCQVVGLERTFPMDRVNVEGKVRYPECRAVGDGGFFGETLEGKAFDNSPKTHDHGSVHL